MSTIRVMVAENDPDRAQRLASILQSDGEIETISTVSGRETAIKQLSLNPDIVVLNPMLLNGHTLSRFLRSVQSKAPGARVVYVLSEPLSDEAIIADIKTGIRGYIRTSDSQAVVTKAVRAVRKGEIWAERRILEKALAHPMLLPETIQARVPGLSPLTNREMEVLTMVLQGASNKEIAITNRISERTVKTHLYRVYRKLNVKSRTKAIALLSQS